MAKPLTKSQITIELAERSDIPKKVAAQVLENLATMAYENARDSFTIPGIGKLVLQDRAARQARNPATGEIIQVAAKKVVKFRVSKACKDAVLNS